MGKIKVTFKSSDIDYRTKIEKRKPYPTCKRCGAKLVSETSIKRGLGRKCASAHPGIIILEIQPDKE